MGEKTGDPGHSFVSCSRCLLVWVYSPYLSPVKSLGAAPCTPPGVPNTDKLCAVSTQKARVSPGKSKEVWGGWQRRKSVYQLKSWFSRHHEESLFVIDLAVM